MSKKKQAKKKSKRPVKSGEHTLHNLSVFPLSADEALTLFMKVDPKKVEARLKKEGFTRPPRW